MLGYIGLGSNMQNPTQQIQQAIQTLSQLRQLRLCKVSSIYETAPMGPQDQPQYCNAVVQIETILDPFVLLDLLQNIEQAQGRIRAQPWGPRTLDLDLLLYGQQTLLSKRLILPHPGLHERSFVLVPLLELDEEIFLPGLGLAKQFLHCVDSLGIHKLVD